MLSIVDYSKGRRRFLGRFKKHGILVTKIDIPAAEPVFLIKADAAYIAPERLGNVIERYGKALFAGEVPGSLADMCFHAHKLPLRMLIGTAADYFSLQSKGRRSIAVSVFDEFAYACKEVSALCRYVRCVRVITSKIDTYEICAQIVYESCGACLMVSNNRFTAQKSDLIISLNDKCLDEIYFKKAVVYQKYSRMPCVYEMNKTFAGYDDEILGGIINDRFTLLCALNEECAYQIDRIPVFSCMELFKD